MDNPLLEQAREWFSRGDHDIEMAQLLCDERGYTDTIAFLIQQGVEKYLKGFLVLKGKKMEKAHRTHDLVKLLSAIEDFDPAFSRFTNFCDAATRYYVEERYPPGPPVDYPLEQMEESLKTAWELIRLIAEKSKQ